MDDAALERAAAWAASFEDDGGAAAPAVAKAKAPPRGAARSPKPAQDEGPLTVFVGNIPYEATDADMKGFLKNDKLVVDVKRDVASGESRGFCVVTFQHRKEATKFIETWHDRPLSGRPLVVRLERKGVKKLPAQEASEPKKEPRKRKKAPAAAADGADGAEDGEAARPRGEPALKKRSKGMSDARRAKKAARAQARAEE
ncbi:hypothetical protein M885DRAFT_618640 [Pelagophyceae sp. CCMP2097]|nr:hypothetical protein M885DRAFT_618640 [Pelagophyceae sp. CCMP2097]